MLKVGKYILFYMILMVAEHMADQLLMYNCSEEAKTNKCWIDQNYCNYGY